MSGAGCACGLVDVHTHWVPERFPSYLGNRKGVPWPSIAPAASACQYHVVIEGKVYRTIPDACWNLSRREEDMAATGVVRQVLSPMPELLSYWLAPDDAQALVGFLNDELAALVRGHEDRFTALGAVPLQDVHAAARELERVVRVLGLPGVEIGSNINGLPLGHPTLDPFFEAAEALGAAVFVHALRPCGMDRLVGPPSLEQVLAFPGEVGLAAASLLTSGTLMRYPRLRIAFSHGGGSLPSLLPRLQHAWETMPPISVAMARAPREMVRAIYVDNLVYDDHAIANLLHCYGETQVMAGTDYPFAIMDRVPGERVNGLAVHAETRRMLARGNALRWLGERGQAVA